MPALHLLQMRWIEFPSAKEARAADFARWALKSRLIGLSHYHEAISAFSIGDNVHVESTGHHHIWVLVSASMLLHLDSDLRKVLLRTPIISLRTSHVLLEGDNTADQGSARLFLQRLLCSTFSAENRDLSSVRLLGHSLVPTHVNRHGFVCLQVYARCAWSHRELV
jgi:hypothetical protein